MSQTYYTILTKLGAELLANATALGVPLKLTSMAVGDGNGSIPKPIATQTTLVNEVRRAPLNSLSVDKNNPNQIIAEQLIPENEGGWFIHEIGLYDDKGNLIVVGNCPSSYKPRLAEGSGRTQVIRMIIIVDNVDSVALKIDPAVVLATREYVDSLIATKMEEHEKTTNHPDATIKSKGFVQLNSAIDSISESEAATPKAIKEAYDLANKKLSLKGGKITGDLTIEKTNAGIILSTNDTNYTLSTNENGQSFSFYFPDAEDNHTNRLIYTKEDKTFNFKHCEVKVDSSSVITEAHYIPVGVPQPWPLSTPPTGWLECNGATFDKNKFPKLAQAYTNGCLPDLRGEFIRGWDSGKGIDPHREILSQQNDAIRNITGKFFCFDKASVKWSQETGAFKRIKQYNMAIKNGENDNWGAVVEFDASRVAQVANENRPRNIAFMYIVKAE